MIVTTDDIRAELVSLKDEKYAEFQSKLIPEVSRERVIGVRTPALKELAKRLSGTEAANAFLKELPHRYFDEDQLHAFIVSGIKNYDNCLYEIGRFLPFVDNWATCDQTCPVCFKKHKKELLNSIDEWISSGKTYKVRFGVKMLMTHFLDDDFDISYAHKVAGIKSEEYYVKMMVAWYFATALAKKYDEVLPIVKSNALDAWTHNKTIRKAVESYRLTDDKKAYLKSLKR